MRKFRNNENLAREKSYFFVKGDMPGSIISIPINRAARRAEKKYHEPVVSPLVRGKDGAYHRVGFIRVMDKNVTSMHWRVSRRDVFRAMEGKMSREKLLAKADRKMQRQWGIK